MKKYAFLLVFLIIASALSGFMSGCGKSENSDNSSYAAQAAESTKDEASRDSTDLGIVTPYSSAKGIVEDNAQGGYTVVKVSGSEHNFIVAKLEANDDIEFNEYDFFEIDELGTAYAGCLPIDNTTLYTDAESGNIGALIKQDDEYKFGEIRFKVDESNVDEEATFLNSSKTKPELMGEELSFTANSDLSKLEFLKELYPQEEN